MQQKNPMEMNQPCFVFRGNQLLLNVSGEPLTRSGEYLTDYPALRILRLGEYQGSPCFVAEVARTAEAPMGHQFHHLKSLLDSLPGALVELAGRGLELLEFDRSHQYCGVCGAETRLRQPLPVRVCVRPECAQEYYPRISPVVIVAVERGREILLGRSPPFSPGLYSTLAGFVDAGESAEQAVHREIMEEAGLRLTNLRYFASQPWPFPHSLMLGFQADYAGGEIVPAPEEIEDARFFDVDELPALLPMRYSMASRLIADFCRRNGRELPPAATAYKA